MSVLDESFFARDTLVVARDLVGQTLCREIDGEVLRLAITEVEAYDGPEDKACHASAGRTRRTEVLYGPPGHWYVYLCYGIHWLANLVTGPEGFASAVLLRGAGGFTGPGRLTKRLNITGALNRRAAIPASGAWIEASPAVPESQIIQGPRIGVDYAGPVWAAKPYRWVWTERWVDPRFRAKNGNKHGRKGLVSTESPMPRQRPLEFNWQ